MQWTQKRDIIEDMRRKPMISFSKIPTGTVFHLNGTLYQKRSTRTAHVFGMPHRWFWFRRTDMVQ